MNYDLFSEITVDYAVIIIITCLNGWLQTQIHSIRRWTGWLRANYLKVFIIRSIKLVLPYQHEKKKIVLFYTNMRRYWFPLEMKENIFVFKKINLGWSAILRDYFSRFVYRKRLFMQIERKTIYRFIQYMEGIPETINCFPCELSFSSWYKLWLIYSNESFVEYSSSFSRISICYLNYSRSKLSMPAIFVWIKN